MLEPIHMLSSPTASAGNLSASSSLRQAVTLSQEVWDRGNEEKEIFLAEWIHYHGPDIGVWPAPKYHLMQTNNFHYMTSGA